MKKIFLLLTTALTIALILVGLFSVVNLEDDYAYLFVYFKGNEMDQEAVFYALSKDGYNYKELNDGKPILLSNSGTGGVRDPYIFKSQEGDYVMLATDMHATYGWRSNDSLITWRSKDLLTWSDESIIPIAGYYPLLDNATAAWAPQAIYDESKGEYMVYFSSDKPYSKVRNTAEEGKKCIYAFYTKDFKTLTTEPQVYFEIEGEDIIDADIVFENDKYRMFYKTSANEGIRMTSAYSLSDKYEGVTDVSNIMCEGSNAYKLINKDKWIIMADLHWGGWWGVNYVLYETEDFENFKALHMTGDYSLPFSPRHGYVITITKNEYRTLIERFGI